MNFRCYKMPRKFISFRKIKCAIFITMTNFIRVLKIPCPSYYIRFINIGDTPIRNIRGSIYNSDGNSIGDPNIILISELPPKAQVWRNRNELSSTFGDTWNDTAALKITNPDANLRLINLVYVNNATFFNFSCYETGL